MKSFFDGTDQENSKTRVKGQIRKIQKKTRKKEWRKEKKEIFLHTWRFTYLCLLHRSGTPLGYYHSCDPSSGEPTHMGTSLPTKSSIEEQFIAAIRHTLCQFYLVERLQRCFSMRPCKTISHVIYFDPTPLIKLKLRLQNIFSSEY
jgi:hypothetical protein